MPRTDLESRLTELTRAFVTRLVQEIRNASFAEVAALPDEGPAVEPRAHPGRPSKIAVAKGSEAPRKRRSAAGRAEIAERVLAELNSAGKPLGVRELSSALGVTADALGGPLRELRANGRIRKHGDKRATKYSEA